MASLDTELESGVLLLRELIYGPAKSKKTWWVGKAAEAGYNVLLFDGDYGWHILKKIEKEAQKRIMVVDVEDNLGMPVFSVFLTRILKDKKIIWDEKRNLSSKLNPNENCISIDLTKLGMYDLVVLDSWTALVRSLMIQYARENSIDLSSAEEDDDKWGYYRWAGSIASWITDQFLSLNCHVVVIAHMDMYEKRSKDGKSIEWAKRQIKSTSGPHAMQMPSQFSDVLYFYPKGKAFKIDTSGTDTADGGSRLVEPRIYNWDDLQFVDLIKAAGLQLPPADNPLIDYSIDGGKSHEKVPLKTVENTGTIKPVNTPRARINIGKKKGKLI